MSAIAITHRGANEINNRQDQFDERITALLDISIGFHDSMGKVEQDKITAPHVNAWVIIQQLLPWNKKN